MRMPHWLSLFTGSTWEPYDPSWLVAQAQRRHPGDPALAAAFGKCTSARGGGSHTVYFVDDAHPNQPGSDWQFERTVTLEDTEYGDVLVDVLKDGRIGSIQLLDQLLAGH